MKNPQVTVAMSVYNALKACWLEQSLQSVLDQTFRRFEFLIITDGPVRPELQKIILAYKQKDNRIVFIENQQKQGLAACLNRTISLARGAYYARMDADDYCDPARLEKQVNFLERHREIALVGSFCNVVDEANRILGRITVPVGHEKMAQYLLSRDPLCHPTVMFRQEAFRIATYNEAYQTMQDTELWCRLFLSGQCRASNIPESLYYYRVGDTLMQRRRGAAFGWKDFQLRWHYFRKGKFPFHLSAMPILTLVLRLSPIFLLERIYRVLWKTP